jgi:hypothetical protein
MWQRFCRTHQRCGEQWRHRTAQCATGVRPAIDYGCHYFPSFSLAKLTKSEGDDASLGILSEAEYLNSWTAAG